MITIYSHKVSLKSGHFKIYEICKKKKAVSGNLIQIIEDASKKLLGSDNFCAQAKNLNCCFSPCLFDEIYNLKALWFMYDFIQKI